MQVFDGDAGEIGDGDPGSGARLRRLDPGAEFNNFLLINVRSTREIAIFTALVQAIDCDQVGLFKNACIELLFGRLISANCGDMCARTERMAKQERLRRDCGRHNQVARLRNLFDLACYAYRK